MPNGQMNWVQNSLNVHTMSLDEICRTSDENLDTEHTVHQYTDSHQHSRTGDENLDTVRT